MYIALAILLAMAVASTESMAGGADFRPGGSSESASNSTNAAESKIVVNVEIFVNDEGKERLVSRPQVQLGPPDLHSPATCGVGVRDETGKKLVESKVSVLLVESDEKHATLKVKIKHFKRSPSRKDTWASEYHETLELDRPHEFAIQGPKDDQNLLRVVLTLRRQADAEREAASKGE